MREIMPVTKHRCVKESCSYPHEHVGTVYPMCAYILYKNERDSENKEDREAAQTRGVESYL